MIAAEAAEAAALQGKFWEMHDLLFEPQTSLKPEIIPLLAERTGLNVERFENDVKRGVVEKRIKEDRQSGKRAIAEMKHAVHEPPLRFRPPTGTKTWRDL